MSKHFSTGDLVRYTLPSIGMMIFTSIYIAVDGFFVSNFVGGTALAAVNFAFPIAMVLGTVGYMLGTGGSAIVAKTRGEGDAVRANELFSLFVYASIAGGLAFSVVGAATLAPLLSALGAEGALFDDAYVYGLILMCGLVFDVLQYVFQGLVMTAGKPKLGFWVTVGAGMTNIVLDALFVAGFGWGIIGAAIATLLGKVVGSVAPLVYFARPNTSPLRLGRAALDWHALGKAAFNGSSEMVTNLAISLVSIVYNVQLLNMLGENGVAAYGVIMYVSFAFIAVFIGYSVGSGPLMSYQYGAQNRIEMRNLFKNSLVIVGVAGACMFAITRFAAGPLADVFVGYDAELRELTVHAFEIYSVSLLLVGFNMYGSSLFTALNNGLVSAVISFVRTFVFEIGAVLVLPLLLGPDGIWYSVSIAEAAALVLTTVFCKWLLPRYMGDAPTR